MKVQLSALEPGDLDLLYTIENDPEMWCVGNTNVPYSRSALSDYIMTQRNDIYADKQLRLVICIPGEEETQSERMSSVTKEEHFSPSECQLTPIGLIDLFNFEPQHQRAELGIALLKKYRGRGYSADAVSQMCDYAFSILHLRQVYCIVPSDNKASLQMLAKVGFQQEGLLKDWIRTPDGWCDAVVTTKLNGKG